VGGTALLTIGLLAAVLWLGSVTPLGLLVGGALCGVAAVTAMWPCQRTFSTDASRAVSYALWGVVAWEVLQLVPLPPGLLRVLSPRALEFWARSDALLELGRSFHPISVDPPGTCFAIATAAGVALTFEAATRLARHRGGRRKLLEAVAIVVQVFAAVTLAHSVFGLHRLYGIYVPRVEAAFVAPLLNPNHAAALACVGPPVLLGLAPTRETIGGRVLAWLGVALTGIVAVLSLSRGGIAVLAAELCVMLLLSTTRRDASVASRVAPATIGGTIALVAAYLALGPLTQELKHGDVSKLLLMRTSYAAVADFRWVGSGRGSFAAISSGYTATLGGSGRYTHAEHWPAQLATELGIPITVGFLAVLAWAAWRSSRRALREPYVAGCAVALGGLVVHDLADFAIEYAGVAMVAATLLAVFVTHDGEPRVLSREPSRGRASATLCVAALILFVGCLASSWRQGLEDEAERVRAIAGDPRAADNAARASMARHPAEAYFPMIIGAVGIPSLPAARFLAHAVQLAPARAAPHYWLARWFWSVGRRPQAYGEYRAAVHYQPELWPTVVDDLMQQSAPLDELIAFSVSGAQLESLSVKLIAAGRSDDANAVDEAAIAKAPPAIGAHRRQIARARAANDYARARRLADTLLALAPNSPEAHIELAGLLPPPDAEATLAAALAKLGDDPALLTAFIRVRSRHVGFVELEPDLDRLRAALLSRGESIHLVHGLLGDVALERGRKAAAIRHYLDGATASPDGLAYLDIASQLAEDLGQWRIAADACARLSSAQPANKDLAARAARLRDLAEKPPPIVLPR